MFCSVFIFRRILRDNIYLKSIQDDAFEGATGPSAM